jgi:hypothetical protein
MVTPAMMEEMMMMMMRYGDKMWNGMIHGTMERGMTNSSGCP